MAVTQIKEIASGRTGEEDTSSRINGLRTYKRVFRITTDDATDAAYTVRAALKAFTGATPTDPFPEDSTAYPTKYSEMQEHDMKVWLAEISYTNDNPLDEPVDLKTGGQLFQRVMIFDANGVPVMNKAGFPLLNPPVEFDDSRGLITFSKNVDEPPAWIYSLNGTLNQSAFAIYDGAITIGARKAKLREPPEISGPHYRNGVVFYTVSGSIEVSNAGWDAKVLNAGWDQVDPSNSAKRIAIRKSDGTEPQEPWPLDINGYAIANPSISNVVTLTFVRYLDANWAALIALLA